jgi:exopolysaccharide biosynthesis predicted pyruvyltransferase EpsI
MTVIPRLEYIFFLQHELKKVISEVCQGVDNYALIDFPDHSNVGDSAIYSGEMALLRKVLGKPPAFVSKLKNHINDIERFEKVDTIFMHGGGNFGSTWPKHQNQREQIIARYPSRKIIQLPQTVHFERAEELESCAALVNQHPDFTLLVRDHHSFEVADSAFTCLMKLCPDAAMALGPMTRTAGTVHPVLSLLRVDHESRRSNEDLKTLLRHGPVEDWVDEAAFKHLPGIVLDKTVHMLGPLRTAAMPVLSRYYENWAMARINRGRAHLSSAGYIVTDRLHVHILAVLLGIKHVVLDNNHGKISEYVKCWGLPDGAEFANTIEKAVTCIENFAFEDKMNGP